CRSNRSTAEILQLKPCAGRRWTQQEHIVGVDHCGVSNGAMSFPNRSTVKGLKLRGTRVHIAKTPQPNETVRVIQITKLTDHLHAGCFLGFNELALEKFD